MISAHTEEEYCYQAGALLTNFIGRATRHHNLFLEITNAQYHLLNFEVSDMFSLSVTSETNNFAGRVEGSQDDIYIKDNAEKYSRDCSDLRLQESTDEHIYRQCRSQIAQYDFGHFHKQHNERWLIHTNAKKVVHHLGCDECGRSGQISCSNCRSTGYEVCNECSGSGETSCLQCSGAGYRTEMRSNRDGDGHYHHEEIIIGCTCYNGSNRCGTCGGHGEFQCRNCDDGYIDCHECNATGWTSTIYAVQLWAEHAVTNTDTTNSIDGKIQSLSGQFIDTLGYEALMNNHASLLRKRIIDDRINLRIQIQYFFSAPSATVRAHLQFENQTQRAVIAFFGQQHYLLDADCILNPVLKNDIDSLVKVTKNLFSVFEKKLQQNLFSAIQFLLASPVLLEILTTHIDNRAVSNLAIAQSSHNSLSEDQIAFVLRGTQKAFAILNCRRLFEVLLTSVGSYALLHCFAYFYLQWCGDGKVVDTLFFRGKGVTTYALSLITLSCTITLMLIIEEIRHQRTLSTTFTENYPLVQRLTRYTFLGSFYMRFFAVFSLIASCLSFF